MNIFQNVTRVSFVRGSSMLLILFGAQGVYLTKWGVFGFFVAGIPLWCFSVIASIGGILFFLWPMIYGSDPPVLAEQSSSQTERMLFLYLRQFDLDPRNILQLTVGASTGILVYLGLLYGIWWPISFVPLIINIGKEQDFKDAFEPIGNFIAFGKPREKLRPIGATRIYVGSNWKEEIASYTARARLVIVRPGKRDSINWEVEHVLLSVPPERILFYLNLRGRKSRREETYEEFRKQAQKLRGIRLPEKLGDHPYLVFDASWNPYFVREANRPTELIRQALSRSGDITRDRLRPVLNALNIQTPPQPDNWFNKTMRGFPWLISLPLLGLSLLTIVIAILKIVTALALHFLK